MSKTICIVLANGFEEVEALQPADIFKRLGFQVILAGLTDAVVTGAHDISVNTPVLLEEVNVNDFDALVLPGGLPGATNLQASSKVLELLTQANRQNKICAAICAAPIILYDAGITEGKKITGYPGCERLSKRPNCSFSGNNLEVDGNIITAIGMGKAAAFAFAIAKTLKTPTEQIDTLAAGAFIN
ncbi:MAG: DJ-1/PfpI family protein [Alphaproteobacteria bacterium]|nr:DJ-1/PfpI family protein [Alphaproteobacteria bacterium]